MTNQEIAKILSDMAVFYEMENAAFKPRAYEKAAAAIFDLKQSVKEIWRQGGKAALEDIHGVGPAIADHIILLLLKKTFPEYVKFRRKYPLDLNELGRIEGLGPKTLFLLWKKLKIKNLKDLEKAAMTGKISRVQGLGEKSQKNILRGIEFMKKSAGRAEEEFSRQSSEAAAARALPGLIPHGSLRGDLQTTSNWTDGATSIRELAQYGKKIGLEYIAVTDHTKSLSVAHGLDEKKLKDQGREIDALNKELSGFTILKSAEVNILKDGSLDIDDEMLSKLQIVGAAVHSHFHMTEEEMTERIVRAMRNPHVDIIFHPTGRLINRREPYALDIKKIIQVAKETGTVLEIDAFPDRLDLNAENARLAIEAGVKLAIDTDAHTPEHMDYLHLGVDVARAAHAKKTDVINTKPLRDLLTWLKKPKNKR